ncbi:MAG TPA: S41 family peptidase [Candidatus Peribacteria bacterium]|nr:S41 family peptidase [Candidatus Peribacteria bacterium]
MSRSLRLFSMVMLPLIMLALGWQLGMRSEQQRLTSERDRIAELFSGETGSGKTVMSDPEKEVDISLLWSVWRLLNRNYIEPDQLKMNTMVFGAVSGMVSAVGDPYTLFMTPTDNKQFQDTLSGTLEGIGAQLEMQNGQVIVVAPLKGSPAEKAGILPRDVIVKVGDKDVADMKLEEVVSMIRGEKGTPVTITVLHDKARQVTTMTMTRDAIHVPSVESKLIKTTHSGSIAYVALNQFGNDSIAELRTALQAMPLKDVKGVVLDLRFNGGGYLEGAVDLVSMFVADGKVVSVERRGGTTEEHFVKGGTLVPETLPVAVIINGGSASASEITAGALQDHKRAKIVGTQSFGKGTVQEVIDLPGGSSLRVTIARWLTPDGHNLGKKGVTPDIVVDRTVEQFQANKDPQLDTAVEWVTDKQDISATFGTGAVKVTK